MTALRDRSTIYANRLFSRRRLDVRARLVTPHSAGGHGVPRGVGHGVHRGVEYVVVHARTLDVSSSGAGVTLTRELPSGSEVVLCFRHPGNGILLCLHAVITRCRGFRAGLRFVQPTAEQRLLLSQLDYA
jgi:hypothetical protein